MKAQGGNDYQLSSRTGGKALGRQSLEQELRRAIDRDELTVYYQPQVDITTRELKGLEALVRWKHPDHVLIEPAGFIALAEQTGLIIPIGEIVMRKACNQMILWQAAGFEKIHVAVNVSARQFHQRDFIGMVERVVAETGLDCECLELEITETMAMQKSDWTIRMLNQLKEMGISIAMDDFGTGQASISYLKKFPIDKVKFDRSFVTDVALGGSDASIVTAILHLANGLNLRTVAEGVETEEQCHFLQKQGCEQVQGYLVSRPLAPYVFQKRFLMQQTADVVGRLSQMEIS
ncbi:MAG TPA: EAL domain-containing protein [Thermoanaerobaculia bacterium]|nr:EAL domain-containing protein [Thermoanaerobaculia bacterium]